MKERPILFSGPMVRAILEGRKTQTRRVVKARHFPKLEKFLGGVLDGKWNLIPLPYGEPGDRLWVRETHGITDGQPVSLNGQTYNLDEVRVVYRADVEGAVPDKFWRPSIHMPRWASRITLEIVNVRVERLQDISEEDAQAEGVKTVWTGRYELPCGGVANAEFINYEPPAECELKDVVKAQTFRNRFAQLWDSINGVGSWDANPFVWVVEFKRVQP